MFAKGQSNCKAFTMHADISGAKYWILIGSVMWAIALWNSSFYSSLSWLSDDFFLWNFYVQKIYLCFDYQEVCFIVIYMRCTFGAVWDPRRKYSGSCFGRYSYFIRRKRFVRQKFLKEISIAGKHGRTVWFTDRNKKFIGSKGVLKSNVPWSILKENGNL